MDHTEINIAAVMQKKDGRIVLFEPFVPKRALEYISQVLASRWIGQGPRVTEFEQKFEKQFGDGCRAISCGSGTDALHLAYLLAGIQKGDEVICTVFTCTATNLPALYIGAVPVFADINPKTLNINVADIRKRITNRTKAIVFVDYGGLPADLEELRLISDEFNIPLIEDAAHALGATLGDKPVGSMSDYTVFSFQAIKHITTGDGGMLMIRNPEKVDKAKRLRWFGIDRDSKFNGVWENQIFEVGYKYQMNDIAAAMGLSALEEFDEILSYRKMLFSLYVSQLDSIPEISVLGKNMIETHAAWLLTVTVPDARKLRDFLFGFGIESGQVHFRNDRYSIFGGRKLDLPNMDAIEDCYLVLPLHNNLSVHDVNRVCDKVKAFFERQRHAD